MPRFLSESSQFGSMSTNTSLRQSTPFSFWYFMHGTQIGTLALLFNNQTVWEKSGRQGFPAWYQTNITLSSSVNARVCIL